MASMCRTVALLLSVGVCALAEVSSSAELTDKAYNSFYFLGPWHVVERSEAGERKLALNFTAGSDEWTLQSAVLLQGQDDQIGQAQLRLTERGDWSLWVSPGMLGTPYDEEEDMAAGLDVGAGLVQLFTFSFGAGDAGVADKDGSHLMASAQGPLQAGGEGSFHFGRLPGSGKHAVDGQAAFKSVEGDSWLLKVSREGQSQVSWAARKQPEAGSGSWLEDNKMWLLGALFIGNLALRLWSRSGRGAQQAAGKPSMAEARQIRREKKNK